MKLRNIMQQYLIKFLHLSVRIRIFFLILIGLFFILFIISVPRHNDVRYCFTADRNIDEFKELGFRRLEDILLSERKPNPGKSIFFHETSCHNMKKKDDYSVLRSFGTALRSPRTANIVRLSARQACAIESAALHNPSFDVFVLFASPAYSDNRTVQPVLDAVLSYSNVHLRNLNLWTYAAATPIYEWLRSGELFTSNYVLSHISDFLRYLTLWRWGGTYLDLDVVVKKSLEDVPPNFSGAESKTDIAAGVMNFAHDGFGHEVAEECLNDLQRNFDGTDWGNNGPGVITRVLQRICRTQNVAIMDRKRCMGFKVYPTEAFYAVPWRLWEHFFEAQYLEETLAQTQHSYIAHMWNKHSVQRRVKVGSNVAYGKLAEMHCPKVYAACGEFF